MTTAVFAVRPEVDRAVSRIVSGAHFTCLLLDDKQQRAAALEAVLDGVADARTRVIWVGNPLRSPLTIERFIIQIVGPEVDLRVERSPAQLVKLMTQPVGDENRLLVVVQQPETMGAEARDILAAIPAHLVTGALQMQFLFVGSTTFTLMTFTEPAAPLTIDPPHRATERPTLARLSVLLPTALFLGVALGVSGTVAVFNMRAQLPETASLTAPVWPETPAPLDTAASTPDLGSMRREFDAFLSKRSPSTPQMTEGQKDALFREFMGQRRRN